MQDPSLNSYRDTAFWNIGKRLLPHTVKSAVLSFFRKPLPEPSWDEDTKQWAVSQVREDAQHLLDYADKSSNFWSLD